MIRWLLSMLRTPSAFFADPWGYARNQIGHGYAVGAGGTLAFGIWPVLALYALWEMAQRALYDAERSDGIEDFANVLVAACAAAAWQAGHGMWWQFAVIHAVYLAGGFAFRHEQRREAAE